MADRFAPGDAVRTSTADPAWHTRLPRYARGAVGVLVERAGRHPLADERARGGSPEPHTVWHVRFPAIVEEPDEPAFHADWEAHVLALNAALIRRGVYNLDEFRDAIERMPPDAYLSSSYYEKWFTAITTLLVEKGVATREELATPEEPAGG